jgi:hypothetical protein
MQAVHRGIALDTLESQAPAPTRPDEPIEADHNLPGFLYVAGRVDKELSPSRVAQEKHIGKVRARMGTIRTRGDAHAYVEEVRHKTIAAEAKPSPLE